MEAYREMHPAKDEWKPMSEKGKSRTRIISIGYTWVGTNVIGLWIGDMCAAGFEFRFGDEPSGGVIFLNYAVGFWHPNQE